MDGRNSRIADRLVNLYSQPILRLRGGGADEKRKAARKRKFANPQSEKSRTKKNERQSLQEFDVQAEPIAKKQRTQASSPPRDAEPQANSTIDAEDTGDAKDINRESDRVQRRSQRFIVFIGMMHLEYSNRESAKPVSFTTFLSSLGNLPYTARDASIAAHFAKVQPTSIRHRTNRENGKSKGFAFLEFAAYDRMKTCLKLYHHSTFDDGQSPSRKLNVELT